MNRCHHHSVGCVDKARPRPQEPVGSLLLLLLLLLLILRGRHQQYGGAAAAPGEQETVERSIPGVFAFSSEVGGVPARVCAVAGRVRM
eukprot:COSAG01_NODE_1111_length_11656_cov_50.161028_3_plen_88_part_00